VARSFSDEEYCEELGIHRTTLWEWRRAGVLTDRRPLTDDDVRTGRRFTALQQRYHGRYSRVELAEVIRGDRELEERHAPPGSPKAKFPPPSSP
jgi:hypothetical protein